MSYRQLSSPRITSHLHLYHSGDIPSETLHGDEERLRKQYDPRAENPYSKYLACGPDDERCFGDKESADDAASWRSHTRRVKRLRFLVEKVLQMSMFDRKKAVFKKKRLDLNEMVENISRSFTLRVEHTGGKIYTDIEAVDSTIYVDEVHFQNVIFNLLDNAVKYGKPGEKLDVYLKTWNDENWLYLSVRDTGVGIKKDDLKKVFEKFYRVHTGNVHDVKGFGLGLAYVKKMVELHGGSIKVDSEYGKGTIFTIKLPVIKDE